MKKPISPKVHGLLDYGFIAGLFLIPRLLKVNRYAQAFYDALGSGVAAVNATTAHGVGISNIISVKTHGTIDRANIALLYGMFASKSIHGDRKALAFHFGLTALASLNVMLTNYNNAGVGAQKAK